MNSFSSTIALHLHVKLDVRCQEIYPEQILNGHGLREQV